MNNLVIRGIKEIEGMKFHDVEGGFGEGKKAMLVKEIAYIHARQLQHINQNINRNRKRFKDGIDIIDLKGTEFAITLSENGIYTQNSINASSNIYLLSERGYSKLLKILEDDIAWEQYDKLVDEYFNMRAEKRNEYHTPKTPEEIMIYQLQEQQKIKEQQQQMKQQINQVNHRTLKVENEIDNLPLLTVDCNELSSLAKRKIVALLGGKDAPAYKKCNRKAFSDLYKELHRNFGVTSMCAIKRKDLELAKQVITNYKFPIVLKQEVDNINNQISLEMERAL